MAGRRAAAAGGRRDEAPGSQARPPGTAAAPGSSRATTVRYVALALGVLLAAGASLAAFLTEDPLYLRLAVLGVAWAFVIAFLAAGGRRADQVVAAGREQELRHAYDLELEREVAARREYELRLENQLRREAQDSMRSEVEAMRRDLAALSQLRGELQGLGALRSDMAHDMERMRTELTEALSGEMLVERIVMRTQSIRMPADRPPLDPRSAAALPGSTAWDDDDDDVIDDDATTDDATTDDATTDDATTDDATPDAAAQVPAGPATATTAGTPPPPAVRSDDVPHEPRAAPPPPPRTPEPVSTLPPPPVPVPAAAAAPPSDVRDDLFRPARPRRLADVPAVPAQHPASGNAAGEAPAPVAHGSTAYSAVLAGAAEPDDGRLEDAASAGHDRLERILAENGVSANDGRRRRRYREDDDGDDVLSRVLGR